MDCLTTSNVLTIGGGVLAWFAAVFVAVDVVKGRREADQFRARLERINPAILKAQPPAELVTTGSVQEQVKALQKALLEVESNIDAAINALGTELDAKISTASAVAQQEIEKDRNLIGATGAFITGHGFFRVAAAILVTVSIPAGAAGGVVANACAASTDPIKPAATARHAAAVAPASQLGPSHGGGIRQLSGDYFGAHLAEALRRDASHQAAEF